jgi:AAA+ ATPase superfamily predicted ATPase
VSLQEFVGQIELYFEIPKGTLKLDDWRDALLYISERAKNEKVVVVIDEYPYVAMQDKSLNSTIQWVIDQSWLFSNIKLILSGSYVAFMEKKVMGYKSPLYGRRTGMIKLKPFDYYESGLMLDGYSKEEKINYYSIFGGVPHYLAKLDKRKKFWQNVEELLFTPSEGLIDEPNILLKEEFSDPSTYSAIIGAIAGGYGRNSEIANKLGLERTSVSTYLATLVDIGFV